VDADWSVDIKGKHTVIVQRIEFCSRRAEPTKWNSEGKQGDHLRGKKDSIGSNRRENRLKGFRLVPIT